MLTNLIPFTIEHTYTAHTHTPSQGTHTVGYGVQVAAPSHVVVVHRHVLSCFTRLPPGNTLILPPPPPPVPVQWLLHVLPMTLPRITISTRCRPPWGLRLWVLLPLLPRRLLVLLPRITCCPSTSLRPHRTGSGWRWGPTSSRWCCCLQGTGEGGGRVVAGENGGYFGEGGQCWQGNKSCGGGGRR